MEGKTADGKTFIIRNIKSIPTNCVDINPEDDEEYKLCLNKLVKPVFIDASKQPIGTIRQDYLGRNWTKGNDGWTSPSAPETVWGDVIWAETDKGIYEYNEAKKRCEEILEKKMSSEDYYERKCELRFNLDDADWNYSPEPINKGFWESISCFFKRLFGKNC